MQEYASAIKNGDERAFRTFFLEAYPRVLRYLNKVLHDNRFTDDVAQEVFIRTWKHRSQIDTARPLEAWLFTITRNTAYSHLQKLLAEHRQLQTIAAPSMSNDTASAMDYKDSLLRYRAAAGAIDPKQLRCFLLHREEGLSYKEIASQEGISVKTVEKYISHVLRHLREAFAIVQAGILLRELL